MSRRVRNIDIKNRTYYFLDGIINTKNFNPNYIKKMKRATKNILIYYIGYVTIRDSKCVKINSVNSLYLIFSKVNGYFQEVNKNKYLTLVPTNESKKE